MLHIKSQKGAKMDGIQNDTGEQPFLMTCSWWIYIYLASTHMPGDSFHTTI